MPRYTVNCSWKMFGWIEVEAETKEKAEAHAKKEETPLPKDGEYVEGSLQVDSVDEIPSEFV
jgi:hypothetical protein